MSAGDLAQIGTLRAAGVDVNQDEETVARALSTRAVAAILVGMGILLTAGLSFGLLQRLPDQLSPDLYGHVVTVGSIHERLIGRIVVMLLILPLALMIEVAAVGWS